MTVVHTHTYLHAWRECVGSGGERARKPGKKKKIWRRANNNERNEERRRVKREALMLRTLVRARGEAQAREFVERRDGCEGALAPTHTHTCACPLASREEGGRGEDTCGEERQHARGSEKDAAISLGKEHRAQPDDAAAAAV